MDVSRRICHRMTRHVCPSAERMGRFRCLRSDVSLRASRSPFRVGIGTPCRKSHRACTMAGNAVIFLNGYRISEEDFDPGSSGSPAKNQNRKKEHHAIQQHWPWYVHHQQEWDDDRQNSRHYHQCYLLPGKEQSKNPNHRNDHPNKNIKGITTYTMIRCVTNNSAK